MCDNKVDGCPDELSFCSEACANAYFDEFVYGEDISPYEEDCHCADCLYEKMIEEGFTSPN